MNWFKKLFTTTIEQNSTEKYAQSRLARLDELKKWEASSPDTVWGFEPKKYRNWTYLSDNQIPYWIKRIARRVNKQYRGPIFIHKRFISYKIGYNNYEGVIVFRGIKPLRQRTGTRSKSR
jgi:hypothetical protein